MRDILREASRFVLNGTRAGFSVLFASLDFVFRVRGFSREVSLDRRMLWLQRWSGHFLRALGARVSYHGSPPASGLLVANHLSYLDILVLAQNQPVVFLSKAEVRNWPVFGWWTQCAGTLFIKREEKSEVLSLAGQFAPLIAQGAVIIMFPEGTSSDGRQVLPFRSSLLEPAAQRGWPVTPVWINYSLPGGSVEEEVCYWGDMTLFPHLLRLLTKKSVQARVFYGAAIEGCADRKELARRLHREVSKLKSENEEQSAGIPAVSVVGAAV